jgi:hypothetical protein
MLAANCTGELRFEALMKHLLRLPLLVLLLAIGGWTLYSYRELPGRAFAADDYQWLLSVRDLTPADLFQHAFDPLAQQHFYRPLIWALFWVQIQFFGLNPFGFHLVSLALHLLNGLLVGLLALRMIGKGYVGTRYIVSLHIAFLLASAFVALHPAPFEAIVWISAQSELVGTCLILLAVHVWLVSSPTSAWWSAIAATLLLALALLAKESAVLGLPFMVLLGWGRSRNRWHYLPPLALTLAFIALQFVVGQQNRVLREGLYGIGPQLITNPLRSLALIVAPLTGTEHADAEWLVPVGAIVALVLLGLLVFDLRSAPAERTIPRTPLIFALVLSLAPTAPFTSPPDSRYLYMPVALLAMLIGVIGGEWWEWLRQRSRLLWRVLIIISCCLAIWWGSGELALREWRFAAGSGPGGSLWRVANEICTAEAPRRMIVVEPPIAPPHVEAIIQLACGANTRTLIVGRDGIEQALRTGSVVIGFPGGSATIEQQT